MIINTTIREKYHSGFERTKPITEIVIHGTGGGSNAESLLSWMEDGERGEDYKKGVALFHYLNDRNGNVYNIIDPERWVYHSSSGAHDEKTIGIENVNPDASNNLGYTDAQYDALEGLILQLLNDYSDINSIIGHGQNKLKYSGSYKKCPGEFFQWERLETALNQAGYNFQYNGHENLIKGE